MKAKEAKRQTLLELVEYACLPCVGDFRGGSFEASRKLVPRNKSSLRKPSVPKFSVSCHSTSDDT